MEENLKESKAPKATLDDEFEIFMKRFKEITPEKYQQLLNDLAKEYKEEPNDERFDRFMHISTNKEGFRELCKRLHAKKYCDDFVMDANNSYNSLQRLLGEMRKHNLRFEPEVSHVYSILRIIYSLYNILDDEDCMVDPLPCPEDGVETEEVRRHNLLRYCLYYLQETGWEYLDIDYTHAILAALESGLTVIYRQEVEGSEYDEKNWCNIILK